MNARGTNVDGADGCWPYHDVAWSRETDAAIAVIGYRSTQRASSMTWLGETAPFMVLCATRDRGGHGFAVK